MTDAPKKIKLVSSKVTGRAMSNGYWDSDHAGIFSGSGNYFPKPAQGLHPRERPGGRRSRGALLGQRLRGTAGDR